MDTFTVITALVALTLIYYGEKFQAGLYMISGSMFWILLAWRMAEPVFYMASAALILFLLYRAVEYRKLDTNGSTNSQKDN